MLFPTGFQLLKKALVVVSGCIQSKVKTLRLWMEGQSPARLPRRDRSGRSPKDGRCAAGEFVIAINPKSLVLVLDEIMMIVLKIANEPQEIRRHRDPAGTTL